MRILRQFWLAPIIIYNHHINFYNSMKAYVVTPIHEKYPTRIASLKSVDIQHRRQQVIATLGSRITSDLLHLIKIIVSCFELSYLQKEKKSMRFTLWMINDLMNTFLQSWISYLLSSLKSNQIKQCDI